MVRQTKNIQSAAVLFGEYNLVMRARRRMARIVQDNKQATNRQITAQYNSGVQNSISKRTTYRSLSKMAYCSRRPHWDPLLSDENKKRWLQWARGHQHWRIEEWKNIAWSDESHFLLRQADGRVRIWHKLHKSMAPSCLMSTVQAGGGDVMVWFMYSWHTLGPLIPIEKLFQPPKNSGCSGGKGGSNLGCTQ